MSERQTARTAVGVMTRAPSLPGGKTRLLAAYPAAWVGELMGAMLFDILELLSAPALHAARRVVFVAPHPDADAAASLRPSLPDGWEIVVQEGADLGARLEHAFSVLLAHGGSAAVVGSDCPLLPVSEIAARVASLADDEILIVPAEDGGYALLALRRLERSLLRDMPWSTSRVAEETRARASAAGLRVRELEAVYDVDEPSDVLRLARDLAPCGDRAKRTAQLLRRV